MFNAGLYPYAVYNTKNSLFTILKNIKWGNMFEFNLSLYNLSRE